MEKMSELKRDLAKGNEIIVRFGNDLEKCKSDLQKYQQELVKSREKVIKNNFFFQFNMEKNHIDENKRSNSNKTRAYITRERT